MRQYSLEWLAQEGFEYRGKWSQMIGPDLLSYSHMDGRKAELEDTPEGHLLVNDIPIHSNRDTTYLFRKLLANYLPL